MILVQVLLATIILAMTSLLAAAYARYRFRKNKKLLVFVKLLPVRDLTLKIAYKSEKDQGWRTRKITVTSVLTAEGTGLDILKDLFTKYGSAYKEEIQIINMGYRSKLRKIKDFILGIHYPTASENLFRLLDAIGSSVEQIPEETEDEEIIRKLESIKNYLKEATNE